MKRWLAITVVTSMLLGGCIPNPVRPDRDGDGFRADLDCDDYSATCNEDCVTDVDGDSVPDCKDGCLDADGDGYGDPGGVDGACDGENCDACLGEDCDDAAAAVHPGAAETACNGTDDDCDSATSDAPDEDADEYDVCAPDDPGDLDGEEADCDDADAAVHPGAQDLPNDGIDQDCDGADLELSLDDTSLVEVRSLFGDEAFDLAGFALDSGDLDGDGYDDLVVGAPHATAGGFDRAGKVYLIRGSAAGLTATGLLSAAEQTLEGLGDEDQLGRVVSIPGDVDGDGRDDLFVVRWGADELHLYLGDAAFDIAGDPNAVFTDLTLADPSEAWDDVVDVVRSAGDLDGDGDIEVLVGDPRRGRVHLLEGGTASGTVGLGDAARALYEGPCWGYAVLGDVEMNGDGALDRLSGSADCYELQLFLGDGSLPTSPPTLDTPDHEFFSSQIHYGRALDGLGDLDGDAIDDLAVGSMANAHDDKRVYIYLGRASWAGVVWDDFDATFHGQDSGNLGRDVLGRFDLDADGIPEMAFGDSYFTDGEYQQGAVHLVEADVADWGTGPTVEWDDPDVITRTGGETEEQMGWSLAAGDLDGDGADELIVGSNAKYTGGAGKVYVYSLGGD